MMSDALLVWRKNARLTQADMAGILGISRNYLSQIERGEIEVETISVGIYRRICEWIGWPETGRRQDTLSELFTEMYTAYCELAGVTGCDPCLTAARKWKSRYTAITGHMLR